MLLMSEDSCGRRCWLKLIFYMHARGLLLTDSPNGSLIYVCKRCKYNWCYSEIAHHRLRRRDVQAPTCSTSTSAAARAVTSYLSSKSTEALG